MQEWILRDGCDVVIEAADLAGARREARELAESGYEPAEDGRTYWVDVHILDFESEECVETVTVEIDPEEPECEGDDDHDWQSPIELVGGIRENPGVFGHGGGVIITEACVRCGCARITDTWAQRRDTGEQGLRSVQYERDRYTDKLAARWRKHGEEGGREDARAIYDENPEFDVEYWEAVRDYKPINEEGAHFVTAAMNAGTADIQKCPSRFRDDYYDGYETGAQAEAVELLLEQES